MVVICMTTRGEPPCCGTCITLAGRAAPPNCANLRTKSPCRLGSDVEGKCCDLRPAPPAQLDQSLVERVSRHHCDSRQTKLQCCRASNRRRHCHSHPV